MTPAPLVFLDTETTGLHPSREAWEIAMIRRDSAGTARHHVFVDVGLETAEPKALEVGGYYDRHPAYAEAFPPRICDAPAALSGQEAAARVAEVTAGAVIVGSNPQFDTDTLGRLLRFWGLAPRWHYRPLCVATMAAGYLTGAAGLLDPAGLGIDSGRFSSYKVSRALGVSPPAPDVAHTAMGDAEWTMRLFDRITGAGQ